VAELVDITSYTSLLPVSIS